MTESEAKANIITYATAEAENLPIGMGTAFDVAIQALEKQIPKKPMISYDERVKENWCSCGVCAFGFGWKRTIHYKYCPNCGQKLDWGNEE